MIEIYFNDANLLPENREEEQYAEAALNNILAGKTADTGMCIMPCFYDAPLHKELLYHLNDGTTLRIRPILNETGEPELLIRCVTEETVEEMMEGVKPCTDDKQRYPDTAVRAKGLTMLTTDAKEACKKITCVRIAQEV